MAIISRKTYYNGDVVDAKDMNDILDTAVTAYETARETIGINNNTGLIFLNRTNVVGTKFWYSGYNPRLLLTLDNATSVQLSFFIVNINSGTLRQVNSTVYDGGIHYLFINDYGNVQIDGSVKFTMEFYERMEYIQIGSTTPNNFVLTTYALREAI